MKEGYLSGYFDGVAAKRPSNVEVNLQCSARVSHPARSECRLYFADNLVTQQALWSGMRLQLPISLNGFSVLEMN